MATSYYYVCMLLDTVNVSIKQGALDSNADGYNQIYTTCGVATNQVDKVPILLILNCSKCVKTMLQNNHQNLKIGGDTTAKF